MYSNSCCPIWSGLLLTGNERERERERERQRERERERERGDTLFIVIVFCSRYAVYEATKQVIDVSSLFIEDLYCFSPASDR